jgi:V8-like Glu-specific endopeptidase
MKILVITLTLLVSGQLLAQSNKVIYGEDNRLDVFESTNSSFKLLANSTAAMIASNKLSGKSVGRRTSGNKEIEIIANSLQSRGICAKERFSAQPSAANCSGFLVAPNIIVTAGHCIANDQECKNYKWVFDYKVEYSDQAKVTVPRTSVYSCKKLIARKLDSMSKDDFAVIELTAPVTDRAPLKFRRSGKVAVGDELVVIGHPTGLPTKIADGAIVRSLKEKFFQANLDTYGGNSGSAVFNVETEEVEGILVRGENDYVRDPSGCQVSYKCTNEGCRGEDVTYITNLDAIKNLR